MHRIARQLSVCPRLFERAERSSCTRPRRPVAVESRDFREVTGSSLHSGQRAHLLFGHCGQFADRPGALVNEIFLRRLDLTDVGDVSWQRNSLTGIVGDFFGPSEYRNWPAMVWTTPAYVSIKNHFGRWLPSRLQPASQMVQDRFRCPQHGRNQIPIAFALGTPVWNIEFRRLKLVHPEGLAPGVPLVRIYSEHPEGTTADGVRLDTSLDINLGFAEPAVNNPVVRLNYPSYAGYRQRDSETGLEILNFRVVHLIRMRPRGSFMESWVQQGILTVDALNGNIIHISGAQRTFTTFLACYAHLGLHDLLAAVDGVADR